MIPDVSIRCVDCGAPVDMTHGGARCTRHRLLDLTNGVTPADASPATRSVSVSGGERRRVSAETLAEWRYLAGESSSSIGDGAGVSSALVRHYIIAAGVPMRAQGRPRAEA